MHPFVVLVDMVRKDYEKFTPTPNPEPERTERDEDLLNSGDLTDFDKQLLVWGRAHLEPPEPPAGLFDRIILAIKREQELHNTRRLVLGFFALLVVTLSSAPFSWVFFSGQIAESGLFQFISIAISDFGTFLALWPDSIMAIAESLPITGIMIFTINMIIAVFTLRLFLHKKRLLVGYLLQNLI